MIPSFKLVGLAAAVSLVVGFGSGWTVRDWKADRDRLKIENKAIARTVEAVKKADAITQDVGEKSAKAIEVIRWRTRTIQEKINVYVPAAADRACTVPVGFVRIHDAAAKALPEPAGPPDDAPSGVALSTVADTLTFNYGAFHETAQRLRDLQDWVRQQQELR